MIRIAIDGPGGAGKSSLAKAVAAKLGIIYVDTGALYRTIGLYMLSHGISPNDEEAVVANLNNFTMELKFVDGKQIILLDGNDVGDSIRTPEVSMAASAVSAYGKVRKFLLNTQRNIAKTNSVIMDGRDIGTVILPDAEVKIFLTASPEARAKRRFDELIAKGKNVTLEQVYSEMVERDTNDSTRSIAPCVPAEDSILLDNSELTAEGTVDAVLKIIKKKEKQRKKRSKYLRYRAFLTPFIKWFFRMKVEGGENIPKEGGYVLCSNHIAVRDVFLIAAACPRQINFVAKKELFSVPIVRRFIKAAGAVQLDRGGKDIGAIKTSVKLVKDGNILAIFPQGHRYPGENPLKTPIKNGAGLIAYRSCGGMIPVFIKTKKNKYAPFRRITVIFGKPVEFNELGFVNGGNDEYRAVTEKIFHSCVALGNNSLPSTDTDDNGGNI